MAQHSITQRAALYIMVGLLLILCASFVPVGWSGNSATPQAGNDVVDAALRPVAHLWSTDVVVPSLHRPASYTAYSPTSLVHRSVLRRLASGEISIWAQTLSDQGIARHDAPQTANPALTNLPARFPLLI